MNTTTTTTATTTPEALIDHYAEQAALTAELTLNARIDLEAEIDRAIATTKGGPCR